MAILKRVLHVNGDKLHLFCPRLTFDLAVVPRTVDDGKTVVCHSDNLADPAELPQHGPVFSAFRVSSSSDLCVRYVMPQTMTSDTSETLM